ncbi:MAG TPA: hypothetical protein VNE41_10060, partial [Chitinophagaceae bacterium]|nr:hypothetical protein [Chitinophagaceae bacterium]
MGRTALQWFPIGVLIIFFFINETANKIRLNKLWISISSVLIIICAVTHFFSSANLHYCFEYKAQGESYHCLEDLYHMHPQHPAIHKWLAGVFINYYKLTDKKMGRLTPFVINEDEIKNGDTSQLNDLRKCDYIIISYPTTLTCMEKQGISFNVLKKYPLTNDELIKINP